MGGYLSATEVRERGGRRAGSRRGQSLIEFTLVMPLLLIMMTGMVSVGLARNNFLVLTNGVNIGTQRLAMSRGQTTDPCATAYAAIQAAAPTLTASSISFNFSINGASFTTTSCATGAADMVQGTAATITATYPCVYAIYAMSNHACSVAASSSEMIQ